jgi:hypothetical protein
MFAPLRWLGLGVVKFAIGIAAGGGVSLLGLGVLAMIDPDRWDVRVLDDYGPPIGPLLLSIGAGLATTGGTLYSLFFPATTPSSDGRGLAFRNGEPVRVRMS